MGREDRAAWPAAGRCGPGTCCFPLSSTASSPACPAPSARGRLPPNQWLSMPTASYLNPDSPSTKWHRPERAVDHDRTRKYIWGHFSVSPSGVETGPSSCPMTPCAQPGAEHTAGAWQTVEEAELRMLHVLRECRPFSSPFSGPAWTQTLPGGVGREGGGRPSPPTPRQGRRHRLCLFGGMPSQGSLLL